MFSPHMQSAKIKHAHTISTNQPKVSSSFKNTQEKQKPTQNSSIQKINEYVKHLKEVKAKYLKLINTPAYNKSKKNFSSQMKEIAKQLKNIRGKEQLQISEFFSEKNIEKLKVPNEKSKKQKENVEIAKALLISDFLDPRKEKLEVSDEPDIKNSKNQKIKNSSHKIINQPLFPNKISETDIVLGDIRDCRLMSALALIAKTTPNKIHEMIQDQGDGTVIVTLFVIAKVRSKPVATKYRIKKSIAVKNSFFGHSAIYAKKTLWVQLIEKAVAIHLGGNYHELDGHNYPFIFEILLGEENKKHQIQMKNELRKYFGDIESRYMEKYNNYINLINMPAANDKSKKVLSSQMNKIGKLVEKIKGFFKKNNKSKDALSAKMEKIAELINKIRYIYNAKISQFISEKKQNKEPKFNIDFIKEIKIPNEESNKQKENVEIAKAVVVSYLLKSKKEKWKIFNDPDIKNEENQNIKNSSHKSIHQPLFSNEISESDIVQGKIGDCWLLSTLASIAKTTPNKIHEIIKNQGDGTVIVTLFTSLKGRSKPVAKQYRIKKSSALKNSLFAHNAIYAKKTLWVQLIEKAIAIHLGGNYNYLHGNLDAFAFKFLLGYVDKSEVMRHSIENNYQFWKEEIKIDILPAPEEDYEEEIEEDYDEEIEDPKVKEIYSLFLKSLDLSRYRTIRIEEMVKFLANLKEEDPNFIDKKKQLEMLINSWEGAQLSLKRNEHKKEKFTDPAQKLMNEFKKHIKARYNHHEIKIYNKIFDAIKHKRYVTVSTNEKALWKNSSLNKGICTSHTYAVLDITEQADPMDSIFLTLMNPHKKGGRTYNEKGSASYGSERVFQLNFADFIKRFSAYTIAG